MTSGSPSPRGMPLPGYPATPSSPRASVHDRLARRHSASSQQRWLAAAEAAVSDDEDDYSGMTRWRSWSAGDDEANTWRRRRTSAVDADLRRAAEDILSSHESVSLSVSLSKGGATLAWLARPPATPDGKAPARPAELTPTASSESESLDSPLSKAATPPGGGLPPLPPRSRSWATVSPPRKGAPVPPRLSSSGLLHSPLKLPASEEAPGGGARRRLLLPAASPRHVDAVSEQAHARVDELMADLDLMMACYE